MRWLTGTRHQIIDIAPNAVSPVNALVMLKGSKYEITFISSKIEMGRIKDELPVIFEPIEDVEISFSENLPNIEVSVLAPENSTYQDIIGLIVRPIIGGIDGNHYKKIKWLKR